MTSDTESTNDTETILAGVRQWAHENEVEVDAVEDSQIAVVLPGEKKLKTTVSITIAARTVQLQAFVIRHPDENSEEFNRWLLMKNLKPGPVSFGIDALGDVYLGASVPRDRLLGSSTRCSERSWRPPTPHSTSSCSSASAPE